MNKQRVRCLLGGHFTMYFMLVSGYGTPDWSRRDGRHVCALLKLYFTSTILKEDATTNCNQPTYLVGNELQAQAVPHRSLTTNHSLLAQKRLHLYGREDQNDHDKRDVFNYIEGFYNTCRRHSELDYQRPADVHYGGLGLVTAA